MRERKIRKIYFHWLRLHTSSFSEARQSLDPRIAHSLSQYGMYVQTPEVSDTLHGQTVHGLGTMIPYGSKWPYKASVSCLALKIDINDILVKGAEVRRIRTLPIHHESKEDYFQSFLEATSKEPHAPMITGDSCSSKPGPGSRHLSASHHWKINGSVYWSDRV